TMLRGLVSAANQFMVEQHGVFQGYYFWHHIGGDRNARDRFRESPWFDRTAEFCARYDQVAFDPAYRSEPLQHFEPLVRGFSAAPQWPLPAASGPGPALACSRALALLAVVAAPADGGARRRRGAPGRHPPGAVLRPVLRGGGGPGVEQPAPRAGRGPLPPGP